MALSFCFHGVYYLISYMDASDGGGLKSIRRGFVILVVVSTVVLTTIMGAISVFSIVGKTDVDASAIMNLTCAHHRGRGGLSLPRFRQTHGLPPAAQ